MSIPFDVSNHDSKNAGLEFEKSMERIEESCEVKGESLVVSKGKDLVVLVDRRSE